MNRFCNSVEVETKTEGVPYSFWQRFLINPEIKDILIFFCFIIDEIWIRNTSGSPSTLVFITNYFSFSIRQAVEVAVGMLHKFDTILYMDDHNRLMAGDPADVTRPCQAQCSR